jgi:hypothetical protein
MGQESSRKCTSHVRHGPGKTHKAKQDLKIWKGTEFLIAVSTDATPLHHGNNHDNPRLKWRQEHRALLAPYINESTSMYVGMSRYLLRLSESATYVNIRLSFLYCDVSDTSYTKRGKIVGRQTDCPSSPIQVSRSVMTNFKESGCIIM